jgi:hypothetical protein
LTRVKFLEEKLRNFRAFLEPHCGADVELKARLATYNDLDAVMPFLLQAVAAVKAGQREAVLSAFCDPFGPAADAAFRAKVQRYLDMFVEVLAT